MIFIRSLAPSRATLRTRIRLALVLIAIGCQARNADVAIAPTTIDRLKLTAPDAKIALVEMLRREADCDPERCRQVWGSTEPDLQLATVSILTNSDGTRQVGIFTVRLDEQNYYFWGGLDRYEGSFKWEEGAWRASDRRVTAQGCIIGRGSRS